MDQYLYDDAVSYARKLWFNGDGSLDWKMAQFLKYDILRFSSLDELRLRRELKPVAAEFGKLSGRKKKSS
jgi:hypothetical protein